MTRRPERPRRNVAISSGSVVTGSPDHWVFSTTASGSVSVTSEHTGRESNPTLALAVHGPAATPSPTPSGVDTSSVCPRLSRTRSRHDDRWESVDIARRGH